MAKWPRTASGDPGEQYTSELSSEVPLSLLPVTFSVAPKSLDGSHLSVSRPAICSEFGPLSNSARNRQPWIGDRSRRRNDVPGPSVELEYLAATRMPSVSPSGPEMKPSVNFSRASNS